MFCVEVMTADQREFECHHRTSPRNVVSAVVSLPPCCRPRNTLRFAAVTCAGMVVFVGRMGFGVARSDGARSGVMNDDAATSLEFGIPTGRFRAQFN